MVLSFPKIGWVKPAGQSGTFGFGLTSFADGSMQVERFDLLAGDIDATGELSFEGGDHESWSAKFSKFKVGNTDIRGQVSLSADGGIFVRLEGPCFDAEPLLFGGDVESREVAREIVGNKTQSFITMDVDR